MSSAIFPVMPGLKWDVVMEPEFHTEVFTSANLTEQRVSLTPYPVYNFTLSYEVLRSATAYQEFQNLIGFFMNRQGSFDNFLYDNPVDDAVTAQTFGTGDGSTMAFQLIRNLGGWIDPVMNVNGTPSIYVGNVLETASQLASPAAQSPGYTPGGTLAAATYFVKTTFVDANGGETLGSAEGSIAVPANNLFYVPAPAPVTGATGWNVYVSTSSGTETKQNTAPLSLAPGTGWTEPTSGLISGAAQPAANTTGYTLSSLGLVTFNKAPASSAALTWSGRFYYRCRFKQDSLQFNNFMYQLFDLKKCELRGSTGNKI